MKKNKNLTEVSIKFEKNKWLRSITQGIPYIGPLIDNLLSSPAINFQRERIELFIQKTSKYLNAYEAEFPIVKWLATDQAMNFFADTVECVRRSYQKEKIQYYTNLFVNYIRFGHDPKKPNPFTPERFLKLIDIFSPEHFKILMAFEPYLAEFGSANNDILIAIAQGYPSALLPLVMSDFVRYLIFRVKFRDEFNNFDLFNITYVSCGSLWRDFMDTVVDPPSWIKIENNEHDAVKDERSTTSST